MTVIGSECSAYSSEELYEHQCMEFDPVAYYNENDPKAAAWLRELIARGLIADGFVDERSIEDVQPNDLRGYAQCHFFAGVGGWSLALRRAGIRDDAALWTGSCPCQPFSAAGQGAGFADERHLWPAWQHLIQQCRPAIVFGEQVASKASDAWIDLVHADLEGLGYSFGSVPFPAAGIGAPHIRDRTYWLGHANGARLEGHAGHGGAARREGSGGSVAEAGLLVRLANTNGGKCDGLTVLRGNERNGTDAGRPQSVGGAAACGEAERLADAADFGRIGRRTSEAGDGRDTPRVEPKRLCAAGERPGPTNGFWSDADWLGCTDAKWRPVEPSTFPLAHGLPARVVRLRGYGNAVVAPQAEIFIRASLEAIADQRGGLEAAA